MPTRCQLLSGSLGMPRIAARRPGSTPRSFTTSASLCANPLLRRRGGDLGSHLPKYVIPQDAEIPEYPYGPNLLFKQSNKGLYGGQMIHFGNNVSHDTETKTRRNWKPNVLSKSLYSIALKKRIKLRVTSKVLKTMDREGGLDEYLLKQSEHRIKELGPTGWALRWTLLQKPVVIARMRADAAALGLPQEEIDLQWPEPQSAKTSQEYVTNDDGQPQSLRAIKKRKNALARTEKELTLQAADEYKSALSAAGRYLRRGLVDTKEDGIKLAFIRANERAVAKERNHEAFEQNIKARFGVAGISSTDQAYQDLRTGAIKTAGSYDKWRKQLIKPETAARHATEIEKAGGEAQWVAQKKSEYASLIQQAENASLNDTMLDDKRRYLEAAMQKANWALMSGGKQGYVQAAVEDWREQNVDARTAAEAGEPVLEIEGGGGADAWAALVDSTGASSRSNLNV